MRLLPQCNGCSWGCDGKEGRTLVVVKGAIGDLVKEGQHELTRQPFHVITKV